MDIAIFMRMKKWAKILELFDLYIFTNGYFPFQYKNHFKNKLLIGFFESDRYFLPIRSILQEEFKVKDFDKNSFAKALEKEIDPEHSICVGVRRGDFTSEDNRGYCDICSPNYYEGGVELIKSEIVKKNPKLSGRKYIVYIFTDDVQWAQKHLNFSE